MERQVIKGANTLQSYFYGLLTLTMVYFQNVFLYFNLDTHETLNEVFLKPAVHHIQKVSATWVNVTFKLPVIHFKLLFRNLKMFVLMFLNLRFLEPALICAHPRSLSAIVLRSIAKSYKRFQSSLTQVKHMKGTWTGALREQGLLLKEREPQTPHKHVDTCYSEKSRRIQVSVVSEAVHDGWCQ